MESTIKGFSIQSKALDKSVELAPTTLLLSNLFLQSSKSLIRTCSVLKDLRYAEINGEKWCSILLIKKPFTIFSWFFEKAFRTLTGGKLVTEYLSSVSLSKGETHAILALSGNIRLVKPLLIAMANGLLKTFGDSFISCGWILSIPADFLLSVFLTSCSTSKAETFGRWLFPAVRLFAMLFSFIILIISWLAKDLQITSTDFLLSLISCSLATLVGFFCKSVLQYLCSGHWKFLQALFLQQLFYPFQSI